MIALPCSLPPLLPRAGPYSDPPTLSLSPTPPASEPGWSMEGFERDFGRPGHLEITRRWVFPPFTPSPQRTCPLPYFCSITEPIRTSRNASGHFLHPTCHVSITRANPRLLGKTHFQRLPVSLPTSQVQGPYDTYRVCVASCKSNTFLSTYIPFLPSWLASSFLHIYHKCQPRSSHTSVIFSGI